MKKIFLLLLVSSLRAEHLWQGNIALPTSQQTAPLFSFGQNLVDKGDILAFAEIDYLKGKNQTFAEVIPSFLYGINDNLALFIAAPIATKFNVNKHCSSGLEDMYVLLEYAFHNKETLRYNNQATVLASVSLPTGSTKKNPSTGLGSPSFFLGTTQSHLGIDWYIFASQGILLTTSHHNTKVGNEFFMNLVSAKIYAILLSAIFFRG